MEEDRKIKDGWDKAQIVSGFISTVVIAAVGILINSSIQNAQIASSEANTRAQVAVSERNNKAQLALTERTADIQRHLQEGTLTGQLVEHLAGASSLKKQLAIVVLRRAIPPEMYQDVITILVKSDTDPEVRKTALEQARTLRDIAPAVVQTIATAAKDSSRSDEERQLATKVIRQAGLASTAPATTSVLYAGTDSKVYERADLNGGIFTHYLLKGMAGEADSDRDGNVRLDELNVFVTRMVKDATRGVQNSAYFTAPESANRVIVGPDANYSKTIVVAIGNSNYRSAVGALQFGATDARAFAAFWQAQGATSHKIHTRVLVDATRAQMLNELRSSLAEVDTESLQIFYYSGRALTLADGTSLLLPIDVVANEDVNHLREIGIATSELRDLFSETRARTSILFIDAAFPPLFSER